MLQEQVERLREADELAAVHGERRNLGAAQLDHLALVVLRDVLDGRRGRVDGLARGESRGRGRDARAAGGEELRSEQVLTGS